MEIVIFCGYMQCTMYIERFYYVYKIFYFFNKNAQFLYIMVHIQDYQENDDYLLLLFFIGFVLLYYSIVFSMYHLFFNSWLYCSYLQIIVSMFCFISSVISQFFFSNYITFDCCALQNLHRHKLWQINSYFRYIFRLFFF